MNITELKSRVRTAINNSVNGYTDSDIQESQDTALDYYYGRPYGNELEGSSSVVTREVMEVIDWMMPSLLRVFVSGDRVVEFKPIGPDDEDKAKQESDVVNHVIMQENDGFLVFHDWFKDALLQKNGYVKVSWDEEEEVKTEIYEGLDDFSLAELLDDDEVEPVEHTLIAEGLHDIKIKRTQKTGRILIENIPPEEVKVSKTARTVFMDDLDFVAHEPIKTASDLIEMGYPKDIIDTIPAYDDDGNNYDLDESRGYHDNENDGHEAIDDSMREIKISECYLYVDFDGDGIAEYRRVVLAGDHVLENEEFDYCPLVCLTPNRMPHKHTGMSEADKVMDLQLINSTIMRQILNNLYLTNNPEKEVLEGAVNYDDLLESVPGGLKRVTEMGAIREIQVPFTAGASLPVLDVLKSQLEARTGVSRNTMGLDADVLSQSTKGAFMGAIEQANQQIEAKARLFAGTGVKELARKVHALLRKYQDKEKVFQIRNEWIPVNPSEWVERKDLTVNVGLGNANKDALTAKLFTLAGKQQELIMAGFPIVSPKNLYNTLSRLAQSADIGDPQMYFTDPDTIEPPAPQPDPNDKLLQFQASMTEMQEQTKRMTEQMRNERDMMKMAMESQKQMHKELMDKMEEARKRADLELKYGEDVPGAAV